MKNKKLILIIGGIAIIATVAIAVIFLTKGDSLIEEPKKTPDFLLETSIGENDFQVTDTRDLDNLDSSASIYFTEDITNVSTVEKLIDTMGFNFERNKSTVETHFSWGDENSDAYFNYFPETNILKINVRTSIKAVINLTRDNAEEVVNRYLNSLGLNYEYEMIKMETTTDTNTVYMSRMLDGYPVETSNRYGATDYLMFSDHGELMYAELLFAKFTNEFNYDVPLIDTEDLLTVINDAGYPKEIRVDDVDFINTTVPTTTYIEGEYSDSVSTVLETVKDCNPTDISLIYYYPQEVGVYVLPTYKINCISAVTYKDSEYSVPSVVYTNAVSPEYISAE